MAGIVTTPGAFADVQSIVDWYESQVRGLGRRFKQNFKKALHVIRDHPQGYAIVIDEFRLAPVGKFPQVIAYTFAKQVATIHAVFHPACDPEEWGRRMRR